MGDDAAPRTGALLVMRLPYPSIMLLGTPVITMDGLLPVRMHWGKEFVPLAPGPHTVTCRTQLLPTVPGKPATMAFDVPQGVTVKLRYFASLTPSGRGWWKDFGPIGP